MHFTSKSLKKKEQKHRIKMEQKKGELFFSGIVNGEVFLIKGLWLYSRQSKERYCIVEQDPKKSFYFKVDLDNLIKKIKKSSSDTFDWHFNILRPFSKTSKEKKEYINGIPYFNDFIRSGRFQNTHIKGIVFYHQKNDYLLNYVTVKGNFSLLFNKEPKFYNKIEIDKIKKKKRKIIIKGKLFTKSSKIVNGQVELRGRDTNFELLSTNITFKLNRKETREKYGFNHYSYVATLDLVNLNKDNVFREDIYDLFLKLNIHDRFEPKYVRLGSPTDGAKSFSRDFDLKSNGKVIVANPYFTFKKSNMSLDVYNYPIKTYKYLRRAMRWSWLIQIFKRNKDVWLVGERAYKAQDTGLAFFRYMRKKHPEKNVYYVIEESSPEIKNLANLGNVLKFNSKEHILLTITSKKIISSHHPDFLFPLRTKAFEKLVKADKIFLQHGVMGTKNMVANYGKNAPGFEVDLFMVSSKLEKEIIVNDLGYDPSNVFVTGLSRFDTLFGNSTVIKKQILIIPTWRDWLVSERVFYSSDYYDRYKRLINDKKLQALKTKYNFNVIFCLHPNMQKFSESFKSPFVNVINQGEINVQHLIKESSLMITDYSSVGFDFSFLEKPIIYYQFDQSKFIGKRPSHIDLANDLPGEIVNDQEKLISLVEKYCQNNFVMKSEYIKRSEKFIQYKDQSSSERIYNVISKELP